MKRRSDKISKVVAVAASEERDSGHLAGRLQQRLDDQMARLGELNAFRHNYARREVSGVSAIHWKDYQSFLSRLSTAVQSQQQIVQDCEQNLAIQRRRWMAKRQRLKSLERVLEKNIARESRQAERQEQKRLDDMYRPKRPKSTQD